MRSDTAEAERAEGGAAGSNAVVPGAEQRGRSTLPSRAARPQGRLIRKGVASGARHHRDAAARPPRQYWPPIMQRHRPDQRPLDPVSAEARIRALLKRTRSLGQAASRLPPDQAQGLPDGLVASLDTTIIQVLEIRAVLLAGSDRAPEAARSARNALMVRDYARGDPLQEIGERHGLSHQRVRHLMLAFGACRVPEPPRRCSICPEPVEAFGLCRFHYYRLRTYGDPEFVPRRGVNAEHGTVSRYWRWMPMRRLSRCQRRAAPRGQGASPPGACHRDGDPWVRLDIPELGLPLRALSSSGTGRGRAGESCASGTSPSASARRRVRDPHKGPARGHPL